MWVTMNQRSTTCGLTTFAVNRYSKAAPRVFLAYPYMYWHPDFNESIGQHTVRQIDQQKLWLYQAAF